MNNAVLQRKREVLSIIDQVKKSSVSNKFRHEMMTYAYVLTNGAIEFMIETILREWAKENINKHGSVGKYSGKKRVSTYLRVSVEICYKKLSRFNNPDYDKIVELLKNVAGEDIKNKFRKLVKESRGTEPEIDAKLKRINEFRHRIAHGGSLPKDEQPNLDELREDFKSVYKYIIKNIDIALSLRKGI